MGRYESLATLYSISWVTVVWAMMASACLTLALVHALIWWRRRRARAFAAFALVAVGTALLAMCELWMMKSATPYEFGTAVRWMHAPAWVLVVSLVVFIRLQLRAGRPWLAWAVVGTRTAALIMDFVVSPNLNFREITALRPVRFLGESVSLAEAEASPWMLIGQVSLFLLIIFVADALVTVWRRNEGWRGVLLGSALLLFVGMATVQVAMSVLRIIDAPPVSSIFFLGMVVAMSLELSVDVFRAAELADDLRDSEERMTLAAQAAGFGVWMWSIPQNRIWGSEMWFRLFGFAPSATLTLKDVIQRIHPDDRERVEREMQDALTSGGEYEGEFRVLKPDGAERWLVARGRLYPESNGRPLRMMGASVDVTGRKQAEDELRESEARLNYTADSAGAGLWSWDFDTGQVWTTQKTRALYGLPMCDALTIDTFLDSIHSEDREQVRLATEQAARDASEFSSECRVVLPDESTRWIRAQARVHVPSSGVPNRMLGVSVDISQQRQSEDEMAELRLELAHLARVMMMSELSTSLAHEINQPLGAILNNASAAVILLPRAEVSQEEIGGILADIVHDAQRAGDVIRKIRGMVKRTDAQFESLQVSDLIEDVVALYRNSLSLNKVSIVLCLQPHLPEVSGDRVRLQQVLVNLLTNAMDAMRSQSSKELTISTGLGDADTITVSVSDSGTGLAEVARARMFEPFFTTRKDGLGMGLRICRSIVEEHGGRIWAENNEAAGATFTFSLKTSRSASA